MLKIQAVAVVAALRPTRVVRAGRVCKRFLASTGTSMSQLECRNTNNTVPKKNARYYHSQKLSQQSNENRVEKQMTLPPNLMFDFKSSFAPRQTAPVVDAIPSSSTEDDENTDEESSKGTEKSERGELSELDSDDEHIDDEFDDEFDDDAPLVFHANTTDHRPVQPLPDRLQVGIRDGPTAAEDPVGTLWLDPTVFGVEDIRVDLIAQNVNYIRNKIRGVRKAKSKTVSERSGSGRKVRPQKGGGQARAGHSRPAHWRGGAKAHGPKNTRDYGNTKLNKRVRALAMRSMLSQKLREGNLMVVNHLNLESHKTGPWVKVLERGYGVGKALRKTKLRNNPDLSQTTTALILDHYLEADDASSGEPEDGDYHASYHGVPINLWVASSNIPRVTVRNHRFLNVYDCLKNEKLIITLSALEQIEQKWRD
mmetsp:Transcript_11989/g.28440  ORF Transcript_11989/g.28440 Transcript_11989/m.28440 type:complete len:424 (-) Transcript_11989:167-1438(-)|eukprot:CAMPEP_0197174348 /NCGR_PEP_ID=MMETSP1423-20130617/909_1 /TAXON_ID=476441 /ORGANISM="Pseudo-nitzschia heimii, Strain UNC1101" /LENGTH=423 /DNA_ID=CAMNT_0042623267 /DNA_START=150 /DNA_END=1421 /DNA_ORIENTATION=+